MKRLPALLTFLAAALQPALNASAQETAAGHLTPIHYELDARIDYDNARIVANARITLRNRTDQPAGRVSLLLYRLLKVTAVRDLDGHPIRFHQAVREFEDFTQLQVRQAVVQLPSPVPAGGSFVVEVAYEGHILGYAETGMRYIQDRIEPEFTILRDDSRAFPMPGVPSFQAGRSAPLPSYDYVARITVPDSLVVANGGRLVETRTASGLTTYIYRSIKPSWRMDFAIAPYGIMRNPPVRIFFLPEDSLGATSVARAASRGIELLTSWFGPLHDPTTLSFIEIPDGWGSQTDATAIIQAAAAFRDSTRAREVYHEISHLWNVPPTDMPSPRWNEGLASFLEYRMAEVISGSPAVDERMTRLMDWLRTRLPSRPLWTEVPLRDYGGRNMTDLSYSVGALFFDQLFRLAGEQAFNHIVGAFYRKYAETSASTSDFLSEIHDVLGGRADGLVDDWILSADWSERIRECETPDDLATRYREAAVH